MEDWEWRYENWIFEITEWLQEMDQSLQKEWTGRFTRKILDIALGGI